MGEALSLFGYTMMLLFLPKVLALVDLCSQPQCVSAHGGWSKLIKGVLLETAIFTLLAPVLMLFHVWFILLALIGKKVSWGTQRRGAHASAWTESVATQGAHTIIGLIGMVVVYDVDHNLALWMSPIFAEIGRAHV